MICKKAVSTVNHAQQGDKGFYFDFLGKAFGTLKPLAKLLDTGSGYYLYDNGTNKILGCRKKVYDLLYDLFFKNINRAAGDFVSKYGEKEFLAAAEKYGSKIWIIEREKYPTPSTREN